MAKLFFPMRECKKCGEVKNEDQFRVTSKKTMRRRLTCRACERESAIGRYHKLNQRDVSNSSVSGMKKCGLCNKEKPEHEYFRNSKSKDGLQHYCKKCHYASKKEHYKKKSVRDRYKHNQLRFKYGIGINEYNKMLAEQNGKCAICDGVNHNRKKLSVDHCHETGKIRGLLCEKCNSVLGWAKDSTLVLQNAISYLKDSGTDKAIAI